MGDVNMVDAGSKKEELVVEAYVPPDPGPYPQDQPKKNSVRFTQTQVPLTVQIMVLLEFQEKRFLFRNVTADSSFVVVS